MASTAGEPSRSTTTIVSSMRFYHVLKIDGYLNTLNAHHGRRPSFNSRPFPAGGRTWHISYRPTGSPHHPENNEFISFYLVLDDIVNDLAVNAQATFSLLDQEDKPVHKHRRTTRPNNFSASRDRAFGYERFIEREALERSEYLKDDCFAVGVNVHVVRGAPSRAVPPDSDMRRHLGDLLSSGEGADVAFRVGGETFAAHRLVLAARSPVLRAELYGPMREGTTTDAIRIDEMEAQVFEGLLVFVCTDTWPEMEPEDEAAMSQRAPACRVGQDAKIGSETPAADGAGDAARKRPGGGDAPAPAPADKRRRPEPPSSSGSRDRHRQARRPSPAEEKVRASHILIKHEGSRRKASWRDPEGVAISATTRDDAADLARALRDQIVSGERKFEDIAAENSDCNSAKRGGDLGSFGRGKMQKAFEKAAFALKVGDISDVVDTESGVHIIKRTG
ncbi:peptidyl-prolyl cis-trans isomerase Pin1-like [Panicum miliaceum]|uniref:Peptidyl-prolyl cis-trans isomerase Pin1 n=1 Tax=Panicum miliaceum TaxID=4540 RepID=A0A3L6Q994_PANMI|nr:peptidyl-prolyl cis-trans isomerase Pin1-like [Panicum miliaceum]